MYAEHEVDFKCPECGHDTVVRVRTGITVRESVAKISETPTDRGGKSFNILTGWDGQDEGKVERYECGACRYVLRGKITPYTWLKPKQKLANPIKSAKQLRDWIKRNKDGDQASTTC